MNSSLSSRVSQNPTTVTRDFITKLKFTKYCPPHTSKSITNPNNIVVAHDLVLNYLDSNPPKSFGTEEYNARINNFKSKNVQDQNLWLFQCKKYLIHTLSLTDLNSMGVAGGVLDEWNKDIARLPELEKEHYGPIGRSRSGSRSGSRSRSRQSVNVDVDLSNEDENDYDQDIDVVSHGSEASNANDDNEERDFEEYRPRNSGPMTRSKTKLDRSSGPMTRSKTKQKNKISPTLSNNSKISQNTKRSSKSTNKNKNTNKNKSKNKKTTTPKARHNYVTTTGAPITLTIAKLAELPINTQKETYGYVVCVFPQVYHRIYCDKKTDYLHDKDRYPDSYNSFDSTYLTKISNKSNTKKKGGVKRKNTQIGKPKAKKQKTKHFSATASIGGSSTATGFTTASKTTGTKSWQSPMHAKYSVNMRLYVPTITFERDMLCYYQMPKFFNMRLGKKTQLYRFRTCIGPGKPIYLATKDNIITPYGGKLKYHYIYKDYSSQIKYPDKEEWKVEDQGTTKSSGVTFTDGIHRHVANITFHYRATGDVECSNYVSYLKEVGLRPFKYYVAFVKYWCLEKYEMSASEKADPDFDLFEDNMECFYYIAYCLWCLDRQLLIQCCLVKNYMNNYNSQDEIDENFTILQNFASHCPITGTHGGYEVAMKYATLPQYIDKLKHFGVTNLPEDERAYWQGRGINHGYEFVYMYGIRYFFLYDKYIGIPKKYLTEPGLMFTDFQLKNGIRFNKTPEEFPAFDPSNPKTLKQELEEIIIADEYSMHGEERTAWDLISKGPNFGLTDFEIDFDLLSKNAATKQKPGIQFTVENQQQYDVNGWNHAPVSERVDCSFGELVYKDWFPNNRPYNHNLYEAKATQGTLNLKHFFYQMDESEYLENGDRFLPIQSSINDNDSSNENGSEHSQERRLNYEETLVDDIEDNEIESETQHDDMEEDDMASEIGNRNLTRSVTQSNIDKYVETKTNVQIAQSETTTQHHLHTAMRNEIGDNKNNLGSYSSLNTEHCDGCRFLCLATDCEFIGDLIEAFGGDSNTKDWNTLNNLTNILHSKNVFLKTHDQCVYEGLHDCNNIHKWYAKLALYNIPEVQLRNKFLSCFRTNQRQECVAILKQLKNKYDKSGKDNLKNIWLTQNQRANAKYSFVLKPYLDVIEFLNKFGILTQAPVRTAVNATKLSSINNVNIGDEYIVSNHSVKQWSPSQHLIIVDIDEQQMVLHCRPTNFFGDASYEIPKSCMDMWCWKLSGALIHGTNRCGKTRFKDIIWIPDLRQYAVINAKFKAVGANGNILNLTGEQWSKIIIVSKSNVAEELIRVPHIDYSDASVFKQKLFGNEIVHKNNQEYKVFSYKSSSMQATIQGKTRESRMTIGTGKPKYCDFVIANNNHVYTRRIHIESSAIDIDQTLQNGQNIHFKKLTKYVQDIIDCDGQNMIGNTDDMAVLVNNETIVPPEFTDNLTIDQDIVKMYLNFSNKPNFKRLSLFVQHDKVETWKLMLLQSYHKFLLDFESHSILTSIDSLADCENALENENVLPVIIEKFIDREAIILLLSLCEEHMQDEMSPQNYLQAVTVKSDCLQTFVTENLQSGKKSVWLNEISKKINKFKRIEYNETMQNIVSECPSDKNVEMREDIDWGLLCFGLLSNKTGFLSSRLAALSDKKYGIFDNFNDISNNVILESIISGGAQLCNLRQIFHMFPAFRQLIDNIRKHQNLFGEITSKQFSIKRLTNIETLLIDLIEWYYILDMCPLLGNDKNRAKILPIHKWTWILSDTISSIPFYFTKMLRKFFVDTKNSTCIAKSILKLFEKSAHGPLNLSFGSMGSFQMFNLAPNPNTNVSTRQTGTLKNELKMKNIADDDDVQFIASKKVEILEHTFTFDRWTKAFTKHDFMSQIIEDCVNLDILKVKQTRNDDCLTTRLGYTCHQAWTDSMASKLEKTFHNKVELPTIQNKSSKEIAENLLVLAIIVFYLEWIGNQIATLISPDTKPPTELMQWHFKWNEQYTKNEIAKCIEKQTREHEKGLQFWLDYAQAIVNERKKAEVNEWYTYTRAGQLTLWKRIRQNASQSTSHGTDTKPQEKKEDTEMKNQNTEMTNEQESSKEAGTSYQTDKKSGKGGKSESLDAIATSDTNSQTDKKSVKGGKGGKSESLDAIGGKSGAGSTSNKVKSGAESNKGKGGSVGADSVKSGGGSKSNKGKGGPVGAIGGKSGGGSKSNKGKGGSVGAIGGKSGAGSKNNKGKGGSVGVDSGKSDAGGCNVNLANLKNRVHKKLESAQQSMSAAIVQNQQEKQITPEKKPKIHKKQLKNNIWCNDKYVECQPGQEVRVLGCQIFPQLFIVQKLFVRNNKSYAQIVEKVANDAAKGKQTYEVYFNRLYIGNNLPLAVWTPLCHWSVCGIDQMVQIDTKYLKVASLLTDSDSQKMHDEFSKHPYTTEKGGEKGTIKEMKIDNKTQLVLGNVSFSKGSGLGKSNIPTAFLKIVGKYSLPPANKVIHIKNYWANNINLNLPILNINFSAIGGDGASEICNDRYDINIRSNLDSTNTVNIKIGECIYMFDGSYGMEKVRLNYIENDEIVHVITESKQRKIVHTNAILAQECNVCVVWDSFWECYVPIWFNELLAYNGHYMHAFDSDWDFNTRKWSICLRDTREGDDNWIWVDADELVTVFGIDWQSYGGDFMKFDNVIGGQGDADSGTYSNSYLNQGDQLLKLIKYFDANEKHIAKIVLDIEEHGIDYSNVQKHKRFNEYGFAIKASTTTKL